MVEIGRFPKSWCWRPTAPAKRNRPKKENGQDFQSSQALQKQEGVE